MINRRASDEKLATALREAGLIELADRAERSYYNDFFSPLDMPIQALAAELLLIGTMPALSLRQRVIAGQFSATKEERDEWAAGPETAETYRRLMGHDRE